MFYRQSFLAILVLLLCVLPVLSILFTNLAIRKLSVDINLETFSITQGFPAIITLQLHNKSLFPLLNGNLSFSFQNNYYPSQVKHTLGVPLEPRRKAPYKLPFETSKAGLLTFDFHEFHVTDPLHLHTFCVTLKKHFECTVLPPQDNISFPVPAPAKRESEEDILYVPEGEQTGDIKELREYRPGDKLKDVHWKMSAKADTLMVKEFEKAAGHMLFLLPILYGEALDATLKTFYNTCRYLVSIREIFTVGIFEGSDQTFTYITVTEEEHILKALLALFFATPSAGRSLPLAALSEQTEDASGIMEIYGKEVLVDGNAIYVGKETTES
ncbi:MAG: DUF58 domain-containing protein [Lachnospiraceae bacterium]|nr:DUF58 domain-containing protein [Lachnospiraceae bacterium]